MVQEVSQANNYIDPGLYMIRTKGKNYIDHL